MRNPFKAVYCEDCKSCMLDAKFDTIESQLAFARCDKRRRGEQYVYRKSSECQYCDCVRTLPFCFKFEEKE